MVSTVRPTAPWSPAPTYWAIMMVAPMENPRKREDIRNMIEKPATTAVRAEEPT